MTGRNENPVVLTVRKFDCAYVVEGKAPNVNLAILPVSHRDAIVSDTCVSRAKRTNRDSFETANAPVILDVHAREKLEDIRDLNGRKLLDVDTCFNLAWRGGEDRLRVSVGGDDHLVEMTHRVTSESIRSCRECCCVRRQHSPQDGPQDKQCALEH